MSLTPQKTSLSEVRSITLKPIILCTVEQQTRVRDIRNQEGIRAAMYTEHEISLNEHLQWISRLKSDERQKVFVVLDAQERPLGVVSVNDIDLLHKKANWAFYLDANARGGMGAALEFHLIEYVFQTLRLEKLNCEVIEGNEPVLNLHKKFGFVQEGFRRENIVKNERRIGVYFLGLTRTDWENHRDLVRAKSADILARHDVRFSIPEPCEDSPLTQIEKARARNNVNWMALLRLSLEQQPDLARPIVADILRLDTEISQLTKKLVTL